ncbi:MAG: flagellar hook-length control protein FliK [Lachnospiraceae bacterium]|nr:flagellar hook-length control protein FliK [Lachnospiraceae bacterium]
MMSTSVADVSVLLTNAAGAAARTPSVNPSRSGNESFTNFMDATAGKPVEDQKVNETVKQTKTVVEKPGRKDLAEQQPENKQVEGEMGKSDPVDAVSESMNEVKEAILEKFEISEEELMSVMETLNISMVDLLNPDMLKEVLVALSGQEDVVSVLTDEALYTDMMDIVNLASDLTDEIKENFAMTDEEFEEVIDQIKVSEMESLQEPVKELTDVENRDTEPQVKVPVIRVEVERSEETRTTDPTAQAQVNADKTPIRQTANMQQDNTDEERDTPMQMEQPQQIQTSTQQVGDVVETVRTFSSQVNGQEIVNQVTDYIKVNISPETTSMELQLHPASLGTIQMHIASQNGVVTAQMLVQSESVKAALESQLAQLQETFEQQGTKVEAVEVAVASYDLDRGPFQDRDDRQDRQNADNSNKGRRRINLNLNDPETENLELSEEDQLAKDVMEMNGTNVDFSA